MPSTYKGKGKGKQTPTRSRDEDEENNDREDRSNSTDQPEDESETSRSTQSWNIATHPDSTIDNFHLEQRVVPIMTCQRMPSHFTTFSYL